MNHRSTNNAANTYSFEAAEEQNRKFVRVWFDIYPHDFCDPGFKTKHSLLYLFGRRFEKEGRYTERQIIGIKGHWDQQR